MYNYSFYDIINTGRCYMRKINFDIKRKINNKKKKNMFEVKKSSRPINKKKKTNDKKLFEIMEKRFNIIYNERLEGIPRILETPYVTKDDNSKDKVYPPYKYEIEMIRNKEFDSDLINKIRS